MPKRAQGKPKRKTKGVKPAVSWGVTAYIVTFFATKFGLHLDPVAEQAINGIVAYAFSILAPPAETTVAR